MTVAEIIRGEENGTISFGNHELREKTKVEDFQHDGDLFKVKTYISMTKLEKNGMFLYESVPGTSVLNWEETENGVQFQVSGVEDAQLTIGLQEETAYEISVDGSNAGTMTTGFGGKLSLGVEFKDEEPVMVQIVQA